MSASRRLALALCSSLLLFAASPGQWAVAPLAWLALLPLLLACRGLSVKKSARLGLFCGLVYYLSLIYWIVIALGRYGGLPPWLTLPALVGLALYMAVYLATFTAITAWTAGHWPLVWTAPLAWVGLDFIRCRLFTGFPWLDLGYSQGNWPLINQVADLGGHYGVTFLIVLTNACLAEAWGAWRASPLGLGGKALGRRLFLPFLLLLAAMSYNLWRYQAISQAISQAPTLKVGLMQGNIDQSEKWLPELQRQTVDTYLALSTEAMGGGGLDLLIWPETALPFFPDESPLFQTVTEAFSRTGGPSLLTGAPHYQVDFETGKIRYFNSAFLLKSTPKALGVEVQRYDKQHLVPFGEYIPFQEYLPEALPLVQSMGNFSPGQDSAPLIGGSARLGLLVCFESIFPEEARLRVAAGANLLVNLTNDAWYGRSSAPFQQVPMAVLRAIENRRGLARAANTGISCLIDPLGTVLIASSIFEKRQLTGQLPLLEEHSFYSRLGFLFAPSCLILLCLMLCRPACRKGALIPGVLRQEKGSFFQARSGMSRR